MVDDPFLNIALDLQKKSVLTTTFTNHKGKEEEVSLVFDKDRRDKDRELIREYFLKFTQWMTQMDRQAGAVSAVYDDEPAISARNA